MKAENINKAWAVKVGFDVFCKDANISKLEYSERCLLYEQVTGRAPELAKAKPKEPKVKED